MALSMANRSVSTLRPVSAANVSGRTNSCAAARHHRLHLVPLLHQQARQLGGLVGRDAAADAENDLHGLAGSAGSDVGVPAPPAGLLQYRFDRTPARAPAGQAVLHQAAPHFFRGDDGGLLGRSGQHRTRAALQLAGALGGHDDEPVGALLRDRPEWCSARCCVGALSAIFRFLFKSSKCFQNRADPIFDPVRRTRSARTIALSTASDSSRSRLIST